MIYTLWILVLIEKFWCWLVFLLWILILENDFFCIQSIVLDCSVVMDSVCVEADGVAN